MRIGQEEIEINKDQKWIEMKKEEITEDRGKDKNNRKGEKEEKDRLREEEELEVGGADLKKQAQKGKEYHKNSKKNKLEKKGGQIIIIKQNSSR